MIAMDPASSPQTKMDIGFSIHRICASLSEDLKLCSEIEGAICNKVVAYAQDMAPQNKACLISLLSMGNGRSIRVARWIAYTLLLDQTSLPTSYGFTPPLAPVALLFAPSADSRGKFEIGEQVDYLDLCSWTRILCAVLTDIWLYVEEEKRVQTARDKELAAKADEQINGFSKKGKEAEVITPLSAVHQALEKLHGSIADTRINQLDRSKAKEELKKLSSRVVYQRRTAMQSLKKPAGAAMMNNYITKGPVSKGAKA